MLYNCPCIHILSQLELDFSMDQPTVGWLLIQVLSFRVKNVFIVQNVPRSFLFVLIISPVVRIWIWQGHYFRHISFDGWWKFPTSSWWLVQYLAFLNINLDVYLLDLQRPICVSKNNVPICLEIPLGRFSPFTLVWFKDTAENFAIEWEISCLFPKKVPIIPAIL